jgi:hypothetical protein
MSDVHSSPYSRGLLDLIEKSPYQKGILISAVIGLLILELFICIAAVNQSGDKSRIAILDPKGNPVYEAPGRVLTSYDRRTFEETFGPISNYRVAVNMDVRPFPFRAWLAAALGVPVGLILLLSFLIRAYMTLMVGEERKGDTGRVLDAGPLALTMDTWNGFFQRISIFSVGCFVVLGVLVLWMVPGALQEIALSGIGLVREFRWFFAAAFVAALGMVAWIVYLRYRLSRMNLEHRLILEKIRMETQQALSAETGAAVLPPPPETAGRLPISASRR